ncbi:MAG: glycoside hydrolase family 88 protein, partial [Hymenobacter sp.]
MRLSLRVAGLLGVLLLAARLAPAQSAPVSRAQFRPAFIKARLLQVARWQLAHPKHSPTDWTNGAFYAGVFAAYQTTHSRLLLNSLLALGERTHWQPGPRYDHADDLAICQTYLNLYQLKK